MEIYRYNMAIVSAVVDFRRNEIHQINNHGVRTITQYTGYATMLGAVSPAEELADAINQLRAANIPIAFLQDPTERKSN